MDTGRCDSSKSVTVTVYHNEHALFPLIKCIDFNPIIQLFNFFPLKLFFPFFPFPMPLPYFILLVQSFTFLDSLKYLLTGLFTFIIFPF